MENYPSWNEIKGRIALRTGLTLDDEIEAYAHFCEHADLEDGVLLEGDVQHEFYMALVAKGGSAATTAERRFFKECIEGRPIRGPHPESPLAREARKEMERYRAMFESRDLVSRPMPMRKIEHPVRVLRSYNYFNDADIYLKKKDAHGTSLTLVMR